MKCKCKAIKCTLKTVLILLVSIVAVLGFLQCESASVCEAKADEDIKEVEKFIEAYYRAYSEKDFEAIKEYIKGEEYVEETILRMKVVYDYGFVKYDHVDMLVYPMSDGIHWLAYVSSDMIIKDLDDALPGAIAYLVGKSADGNFYIDMDGELDQDLIEEVHEILLSDEIIDMLNKIQCRYNEILTENPDVMEWTMEVSDAQTQAIGKALEEKSGKRKENYYRVRKGDCLWSIAEEKLGDGMYWSKIYEINKKVIGDDPDLLYIGIELKLPES